MSPSPRKIIIVDDDPEIRRLVVSLLIGEGYDAEGAENGRALDACMARMAPDLLVLDLMLPGEDGLSICRRVRRQSNVPILMLTARADEMDCVVGLEVGADDYVTKPFMPRAFIARVRALLRRSDVQALPSLPPSRRFEFDRFRVDLDARLLTDLDGTPIPLTSAEFDLLSCFVLHPRRVLSRDRILDWTHGHRADPFDRTVDLAVSRLRRKLEPLTPDQKLISTVRNGGYLLTAGVRQIP